MNCTGVIEDKIKSLLYANPSVRVKTENMAFVFCCFVLYESLKLLDIKVIALFEETHEFYPHAILPQMYIYTVQALFHILINYFRIFIA